MHITPKVNRGTKTRRGKEGRKKGTKWTRGGKRNRWEYFEEGL